MTSTTQFQSLLHLTDVYFLIGVKHRMSDKVKTNFYQDGTDEYWISSF